MNNFSKNCLPIAFLIDINKVYLPLSYGDDEQTNFVAKVKNLDKSKKKQLKKNFFLNNLGLFLVQ